MIEYALGEKVSWIKSWGIFISGWDLNQIYTAEEYYEIDEGKTSFKLSLTPGNLMDKSLYLLDSGMEVVCHCPHLELLFLIF